jgi:hypothetical protein
MRGRFGKTLLRQKCSAALGERAFGTAIIHSITSFILGLLPGGATVGDQTRSAPPCFSWLSAVRQSAAMKCRRA